MIRFLFALVAFACIGSASAEPLGKVPSHPVQVAQSLPFPGPGIGISGCAIGTTRTAFSKALGSSGVGNQGTSIRVVVPLVYSGPNGCNVRASFLAIANFGCDNASVGIQGSGANTTVTPVQLKFGGSNSFSITAAQTATSDFVSFPTVTGQTLIVVCDINSVNGAFSYGTGPGTYQHGAPSTSYNLATVSGFSLDAVDTYAVSLFEVQ